MEGLFPKKDLYIHSGRVACRFLGNDTLYTLAWVHDLVEDGYGTLDEISERFHLFVPQKEVLDALTRRKDEEYFQYIRRVQKNPLAVTIKLQDLEDNICRNCSNISAGWSLLLRYAKAYGILTGGQK